jgi:SAM-dependent methyltransferase
VARYGSQPSAEAANELLAGLSNVRFYQIFEIVPGVSTPGGVDTALMMEFAQIPHDLKGKTVLDVGCFNGGVGFLCERRGAERIVCIDVEPDPRANGFAQIREFLGSKVEYVHCNLYDLTQKGLGKFDYVICFGVLYHLRHLLLGIDMLYAATREACFIETAFGDSFLPLGIPKDQSLLIFDRPHLYNPQDHSNWFLPTLGAYGNMFESCGFQAELKKTWPAEKPHRCTFKCVPKLSPEWIIQGSYEGEYPADRFRDLTRPRA